MVCKWLRSVIDVMNDTTVDAVTDYPSLSHQKLFSVGPSNHTDQRNSSVVVQMDELKAHPFLETSLNALHVHFADKYLS